MKIEKLKSFFAKLHDKTGCYAHKKFKASFKPWANVKNVQSVMKFNKKDWLKPYIDMNTNLRKEAKNDFEKDFFKLANNSVFGKTIENMRRNRGIKYALAEKNYLVSEPNITQQSVSQKIC